MDVHSARPFAQGDQIVDTYFSALPTANDGEGDGDGENLARVHVSTLEGRGQTM